MQMEDRIQATVAAIRNQKEEERYFLEKMEVLSRKDEKTLLAEIERDSGCMNPSAVLLLCGYAFEQRNHDTTKAWKSLQVAEKILLVLEKREKTEIQRTAVEHAWGEYYKTAGVLHGAKGEYKEAQVMFKRSEDRYESITDMLGVAAVGINQGIMFFNQQRYDEALAHYAKADDIAKDFCDAGLSAKVALNRGSAFLRMERWDESLSSYETGRVYFEAKGDELFTAHCYLGKGDCLRRLKNPEAISVLEHARKIYRKLSVPLYDARVDWNIGGYYDAIGEHGPALGHYKQAFGVFEKHENASEQALVSLDIAKIYLMRKLYDEARTSCLVAIPALERQGMAEVREAMAYMTEALQKKKQTPELLGLLEKISNFIRDASTNPELKFNLT